MPKGKGVFILILLLLSCWACEKDDICVDGDTPLLVIRFYDSLDTTSLKAVPTLRVYGLGQTTTVNTFSDRSSTDSIGIPLRALDTETTFVMVSNSAGGAGEESGNLDTLRITYVSEEVFISRACGYVANYMEVQATPTPDAQPWIQGVSIQTPNISNQTSAHVKIFH